MLHLCQFASDLGLWTCELIIFVSFVLRRTKESRNIQNKEDINLIFEY